MITYSFHTNYVHIILIAHITLIIHKLYIVSITYDVRMNINEHE